MCTLSRSSQDCETKSLWMLLPNQNLLESSTGPFLVISSEMLLVWPAPVKTCHSVGAGARKDQVGATIPWWARPQWVPPTPTHKSLPSMRVLPGQLATDCAKAESTIVHCCPLSLWYLDAEMIITEIQISIQRSSSGLLTMLYLTIGQWSRSVTILNYLELSSLLQYV